MSRLNYYQGKLFALISLLLLSHLLVVSQTIIQGTILDEKQNPLTYTNIALFHSVDSSLLKGELTDEKGAFIFRGLETGKYFIQVSMLGYKSFSSVNLSVETGKSINLGEVSLFPQVVELNTVEIKAEKPIFEQQKDRVIINVQNIISSSGSSVIDILEKSPGVAIDRLNNRISLQGKDGVSVIINGKQNRMPLEVVFQLLAGTNGNDVEIIELITNPPASFDAEGTGGVINIILKKKKDQGTNATYTLMAGYGQAEKSGLSLHFNHRKKKLNIYGNYSGNHDHTIQDFADYRTVVLEDEEYWHGQSDREAIVNLNNASLGIDYQLTPKTVIGGLATFYDRYWDMDAENQGQLSFNGQLAQSSTTQTKEINNWRHWMGNLNLQHSFSDEDVLNVNIDYLSYQNHNPTNYKNRYFNPEDKLLYAETVRVGKQTPIRIAVAKADYQKRMNDKMNWAAGLKATASDFTNAVQVENEVGGFTETDLELTQTYYLKEYIYGAYTNLNLKPDDKTEITMGLRYEHTLSDLGTPNETGIITRDYGNFFPSLSASRTLNEVSQIHLAYQRRITRPTYNDMAPFVIFLSPSTFFAGNTNILASISDGVKLDYRWKTLFVSLSLTSEKNAITNFQPKIDAEENKLYFASDNLDRRNTANLTVSLPVKINDWWEMQNSISGNLTAINSDYQDGRIALKLPSYRIQTTQSFQLPAGVSAEISGFYQSVSLFGITRLTPSASVNIGLQKKFEKINASINLAANDIFYTNIWIWDLYMPALNFDMGGRFIMEPRSIRLTFTQTLGNRKLNSRRHRETASKAERQRVNN